MRDWGHGEVREGDSFMLPDGRSILVLAKDTAEDFSRGKPVTLSTVRYLDEGRMKRETALLFPGDEDPVFCWGERL